MDRLKIRQPPRIFLIFLLLFSLISFSLGPGKVKAAPVYDQDNGTWTDGYSDNTGLSSRSNIDVDVSDGKLKLTNSGGGFTPPFNTSGYAYTTTIMPTSVAEWGTITYTAETPENTTITIQVLDSANNVYSNTLLSGNQSGFSSSPIDISSLPPDRVATDGDAKIARIRLKITLATTDTDVTPAIDDLVLSWTVSQGDTSASALASTAWPIYDADKRGTRHLSTYSDPVYPVIRWVVDQGQDAGGYVTRGSGETIYKKTQGSIYQEYGKLSALNRLTGATTWERAISGFSYTTPFQTVSANGTIYISCIFNDILQAYDASDGSLKWTYQFYGTHSNQMVAIGDDGTIYTIRDNGDFTVYAFNPNGSVKWTKNVDPTGGPGVSQIVFASDGTIYFGTSTSGETGNGELYALDPSDGSIDWDYPTGDIVGITPIVDTDGTIYTAHNTNASIEKKVFAINANGTLKWERSIGTSTDRWLTLSLRSDGILLAERLATSPSRSIEAIDTSDGSLEWSVPITSTIHTELFSDGLNGFYIKTITSTPDSSLYYFDSSGNQKWRLYRPQVGSSIPKIWNLSADEDGHLYADDFNHNLWTSKFFALFPWTLSTSTDTSTYYRGETVTFTVTTSMQRTNLLSGDANKVQVVVDNDDKVNLSYNSTNGDGDTVWIGTYEVPISLSGGSHTYTVEANAAGIQTDISLNFVSPATDSNNTGYTTSDSFTVDATGISLSTPAESVTNTSAAITWTTNLETSTKVEYGLTSDYGNNTTETNTSPRVTSHSASLSNLVACTTYHYRVISRIGTTHQSTSANKTFNTTGCLGNATVEEHIESAITTASGGTVNLLSNQKGITLTIPAAFASSDATFQIKRLNKNSIINTTGTPNYQTTISTYVYDLKALEDISTTISSFNQPITVKIIYGDSDISGVDESTLLIYRWYGTAWDELDSCQVSTSNNQITCTTTSFSVFALFGTSTSISLSSSSPVCGENPLSAPWLYQALPEGQTSVRLSFQRIGNSFDHYVLEYGVQSGNYLYAAENIGNSQTQDYLVQGLLLKTTYYFRIRGDHGCGPGPWSGEILARTGSVIPKKQAFPGTTLGLLDELAEEEEEVEEDIKELRFTLELKPVTSFPFFGLINK